MSNSTNFDNVAQSENQRSDNQSAPSDSRSESANDESVHLTTRRGALKQLGVATVGFGIGPGLATADELQPNPGGGDVIQVHIGHPADNLQTPNPWPVRRGVENAVADITHHAENGEFVEHNTTEHDTDVSYTNDEEIFIKKVVRHLHYKEGVGLTNHDRVVIPHSCWQFGYGDGGIKVPVDDSVYWGAAVYSGPFVRDYESRFFAHHELGHNFCADHEHGGYVVDEDGFIDRISPMATGYTYGYRPLHWVLTNDVQHPTSGRTPDRFKGRDGLRNFQFIHATYDLHDHHEMTYTNPTLRVIDTAIEQPCSDA